MFLENTDYTTKEVQKAKPIFAIIGGVVIIGLGVWRYYNGYALWRYFLDFILGSAVILVAIIFPVLLAKLSGLIEYFLNKLSFIVTGLTLIFLYYLIITPIAFLAYSLGVKFMDLKPEPKNSYWVIRAKSSVQKSDYRRQY